MKNPINIIKSFRRDVPDPLPQRPYILIYNQLQNSNPNYDSVQAENNSVVNTAINWLTNQCSLATPTVVNKTTGQPLTDDRILRIILNPNSNTDWNRFLRQFNYGLIINGSLGIIPLPVSVENDVKPFGFEYVSYKSFDLQNKEQKVMKRIYYDIREGFDYEGKSPLESVMAEIIMDNTAFNVTNGALKSPQMSVIISAKSEGEESKVMTQAEADKLKEDLSNIDRLYDKFRIAPIGLNIDAIPERPTPDMIALHNVAEERICSILGVSPAVLSLGTGLQQTKVGAVMEVEMRKSWESGVRPLLRKIETEINKNVIPWFSNGNLDIEFRLDTSKISWYSESERVLKQRRLIEAMDKNLITLDEAKLLGGY